MKGAVLAVLYPLRWLLVIGALLMIAGEIAIGEPKSALFSALFMLSGYAARR
jgi:hypothetical protein